MSRLVNSWARALKRQSRSTQDDSESGRPLITGQDHHRLTKRPTYSIFRFKTATLDPIREDDESEPYPCFTSSMSPSLSNGSSASLTGTDDSISSTSSELTRPASESYRSSDFCTPLSALPIYTHQETKGSWPVDAIYVSQSVKRTLRAPTPSNSPASFQSSHTIFSLHADGVDYRKPLPSLRSITNALVAYETTSPTTQFLEESYPYTQSRSPSAYSATSYAAREHRASQNLHHRRTNPERIPMTPPIVLNPPGLPTTRKNWQVLLKGTYNEDGIDQGACHVPSHPAHQHTQEPQNQGHSSSETSYADVFAALERRGSATPEEDEEEVPTVQHAGVCLMAKCKVRERRKYQVPEQRKWMDLIVLEPILETSIC